MRAAHHGRQYLPSEEFSVYIPARNSADRNGRILTENQLEKAEHRHPGRIVINMAACGVRLAVCIAQGPRADHLAAIKWLNKNTADGFAKRPPGTPGGVELDRSPGCSAA